MARLLSGASTSLHCMCVGSASPSVGNSSPMSTYSTRLRECGGTSELADSLSECCCCCCRQSGSTVEEYSRASRSSSKKAAAPKAHHSSAHRLVSALSASGRRRMRQPISVSCLSVVSWLRACSTQGREGSTVPHQRHARSQGSSRGQRAEHIQTSISNNQPKKIHTLPPGQHCAGGCH